MSVSATQYASIAAASTGDNTLVAAVVGKKIRVLSLVLLSTANQTVRFESGASGTALTGQMELAADAALVLPFNPEGWFETAAAALLNLELPGSDAVAGCLSYVEVA